MSEFFGSKEKVTVIPANADPREVLASVGIKVERLAHAEAPQEFASFSIDGRQAETHDIEEFMADFSKAFETGHIQAFKTQKFPRH